MNSYSTDSGQSEDRSTHDTGSREDRGSRGSRAAGFLKRFGAMYALGLTGVVALGLAVAGVIPGVVGLPTVPGVDPALLAVAAVLNSALLLAVAVAVGVALTPRVGLRSHLLAWVGGGTAPERRLREEVPLAAGVGALTFAVVAGIDLLSRPFLGGLTPTVPTDSTGAAAALVGSLPFRLLYGGVTEELLLRFGFMTLVLWALWAVARRLGDRTGAPDSGVAWASIVVAALLFGVGHLPAAATITALTPAVVAVVVGLNAVAGVGFGWLYWRRSLEAAVVGHAAFHVVLVAVSLALLAI
ncbi:CPBP family intramembrane glutamic endopeptidase [Halobium salinum]|uniref:CPBP family intramembrane glutamic endopeptidase n=1 Tax=Halobium salinum TaxID=1364940 RepID=A0ABD5PC74_9EURY|nr:CPBP family intramembrane glutamic endopeptidase [Halobium salinum]